MLLYCFESQLFFYKVCLSVFCFNVSLNGSENGSWNNTNRCTMRLYGRSICPESHAGIPLRAYNSKISFHKYGTIAAFNFI